MPDRREPNRSGKCPKCKGPISTLADLRVLTPGTLSATVLCPGCNCSIGLGAGGKPTVVYDPSKELN